MGPSGPFTSFLRKTADFLNKCVVNFIQVRRRQQCEYRKTMEQTGSYGCIPDHEFSTAPTLLCNGDDKEDSDDDDTAKLTQEEIDALIKEMGDG